MLKRAVSFQAPKVSSSTTASAVSASVITSSASLVTAAASSGSSTTLSSNSFLLPTRSNVFPCIVPNLTRLNRFCSASSSSSSSSSDAEKASEETQKSALDDISSDDKELIARLLHNPASLPKYEKHPMGDGGGGGNTRKGDMAVVFTCNVCKKRSAKMFTKASYTTGIVIVQCYGCGNKHLLADHLGWFEDDKKTIEDILKEKGEEVKRVSLHVDRPSPPPSSSSSSSSDPTS